MRIVGVDPSTAMLAVGARKIAACGLAARIGLVAPLMLGELLGAMAWLIWPLDDVPRQVAWLGAALAVTAWVATMFVSVPKHKVLAVMLTTRD